MSPTTPARFSAVIATYNRKDYVLETVRSVIEQTYAAHEIIVVDDGGDDGTAEAIRSRYPQVIVFAQKNLGRSVARNSGIALATGNWICFIDDDDLWHREKLEVSARYIESHPDCQAINNPIWFFSTRPDGPTRAFGFDRDFVAKDLEACHAAVSTGDPSTNPKEYLEIKGDSFRSLLERNRGVMSASMVRRDTLIRAGCFSPMQGYADDWTMFLNVARFAEWHTLDRRLGFTRLHETQSPGELNGLIIFAAQINAWFAGRSMPHRTTAAEMLMELSNYGLIYRRSLQGCFWEAIYSRNWRLAGLVRAAGRMLLPRRRDRLFMLIPPQVTWRYERYILGLHIEPYAPPRLGISVPPEHPNERLALAGNS
ncbi:MAG: glycosyltransferase family A protein [Tepidisphaeraceae bacterium]|jgi:glycosyltransferase involved in cell wall biosynthesis